MDDDDPMIPRKQKLEDIEDGDDPTDQRTQ
jgi:hypothetical protein